MTQTDRVIQFRKRYIAMAIGLCALSPVHAMQSLSDDALSDATGEGVAIVLDDFKMVMQKPNDLSTHSSYNRLVNTPNLPLPEQSDTGFIRIIPTGENYNLYYDRVHKKIFDQNYPGFYNNFYTNNYVTLYDRYSKQKYDEIYQAGSNTSPYYLSEYANIEGKFKQQYTDYRVSDLYNNSTEKFSIASRNPEGNLPTTDNFTFKEYYEDRKDQYFWSRVRQDGTIDHGDARGNSDRAGQRAWLNTVEMIWRFKTTDINNYVANRLHETTLTYLRITATNAAEEEGEKKAIADITQFAVDAAKGVADSQALDVLKGSRSKADIFIYGLALSSSEGNTDLNQRYSNVGLKWGTAANPWMFRAGNQEVQQFHTGNSKRIGFIALEAPLAKNTIDANGVITKDTSDNNIKLGFWSDIFARPLESDRATDPITGAPSTNDVSTFDNALALDPNYRLRTQFVANGLSLNGSQVRLFQTLDAKAEAAGVNAKPRSPDHYKTLGIAALIRMNTNDNPNGLEYTPEIDAQGRVVSSAIDLNKTALNGQAIRISTAEQSNDAVDTPVTPALSMGALAPLFNANEGLYLYSPNINLVLGQMNQPFVFGSEGNNIILEVTRIPDVAAIYHSIYQNYANANVGKNYRFNNVVTGAVTAQLGMSQAKGATCNVYYCGNEFAQPNTTAQYQGRNATHSSISIGSVSYDRTTNSLNAQRDNNSTGIVFKDRNGIGTNLGSAAIDGVLIQHLKIKTTGL